MEMRKKRYYINGNLKSNSGIKSYSHYVIFYLYKQLSGYTQSYLKPFSIILFSTFLFFPTIYYIVNNFNIQENHVRLFYSNLFYKNNYLNTIGDAFQLSFSNTLFFLKTPIKSNWWLMSLQKVFSSVMLTFFILALRKKFKQ